MPTEPGLHLVEDPQDSCDLVELIASVTGRPGECAVLHPTPGLASSRQLASDLLVSLGKRFDTLAFERVGKRAWELVEVWMRAEGVRHLFVLRAHLLDARRWHELIGLARAGGMETWFVVGGKAPERVEKHLAATAFRHWHRASFEARWRKREPHADCSPEDVELGTLPADDFFTFRSACRRLLDPVSFERVDAIMRDSTTRTSAAIGPWRPGPRRPTPPALELSDVGMQLQALLVDAESTADALVRLRGAQAAYFRDGWLVEFRPPLVPSDSDLVPLGPGLNRATAARLRRLCAPRSTAAMALFLVADLRSVALRRLNVGDVDGDGGAVAVDDHRFAVPDYARSLVLAQLIERKRAGASAEDPLFVHPRTGGRPPPSSLRNVLRSVAGKVGIAVGVHDSFGTSSSRWLGGRAFTLTALERVPAMYQ